jgi:hypothetical protein
MNKYYLYDSDKPNKKYYILFTNPKTGREKRIYFGAIKPNGEPYEDYTIHKNDERKKRYINRHRGMGEKWNDPTTAGFYALHLLWNKPSLGASIKDTNEKYGIKIIRKRK